MYLLVLSFGMKVLEIEKMMAIVRWGRASPPSQAVVDGWRAEYDRVICITVVGKCSAEDVAGAVGNPRMISAADACSLPPSEVAVCADADGVDCALTRSVIDRLPEAACVLVVHSRDDDQRSVVHAHGALVHVPASIAREVCGSELAAHVPAELLSFPPTVVRLVLADLRLVLEGSDGTPASHEPFYMEETESSFPDATEFIVAASSPSLLQMAMQQLLTDLPHAPLPQSIAFDHEDGRKARIRVSLPHRSSWLWRLARVAWPTLYAPSSSSSPSVVHLPVPCEDATWWQDCRAELLRLHTTASPRLNPPPPSYVYHLPTLQDRCRKLQRCIPAVDAWFYACKANTHPAIVRAMHALGLHMECVSLAELRFVRSIVPSARLLFTPNFCPVNEYAEAFALGAECTIDGPDILGSFADVFRGQSVALRVDPGLSSAWRGGQGGEAAGASPAHHAKVTTAGKQQKFGACLDEMDRVCHAAHGIGARIIGLHAHVGSGMFDTGVWSDLAVLLAALVDSHFPHVRWIDLGGGLGVVEKPGQSPLDLAKLQARLAAARDASPTLQRLQVRMEPGRYCVAPAGVLLCTVTQVRHKADTRLVGVNAGMHTLLRCVCERGKLF